MQLQGAPHYFALLGTALHNGLSSALHCTALHCTALHCTALHNKHYTALHCTVASQCHSEGCDIAAGSPMVMQYSLHLHHTVSYHTIPHPSQPVGRCRCMESPTPPCCPGPGFLPSKGPASPALALVPALVPKLGPKPAARLCYAMRNNPFTWI